MWLFDAVKLFFPSTFEIGAIKGKVLEYWIVKNHNFNPENLELYSNFIYLMIKNVLNIGPRESECGNNKIMITNFFIMIDKLKIEYKSWVTHRKLTLYVLGVKWWYFMRCFVKSIHL